MKPRGTLAVVLHSHMPYVEGFGTWPFGEEWLFEAMSTVYLPLIELAEEWGDRGREDVLTLSLTPVLCDQLELESVRDRLCTFLGDVRLDCFRSDAEQLRANGDAAAAESLDRSKIDYEHALEGFESDRQDLLTRICKLAAGDVLDLWTSCATHPVLPLLATEAGRRLQIDSGVASHRRRFDRWSGGFWLPECAYELGGERLLAENTVQCFCVDQSRWTGRLDALQPVATASGPTACPIDWPTVELVWSNDGYPAHADYRDYHVHSSNGLRPYRNGGGAYDHELGKQRARTHARDFLAQVASLMDEFSSQRGRAGLVTCALDTELLGHWWYEGQTWLAEVVGSADEFGIELGTLPSALERFPASDRPLQASSWGTDKDLVTWDSEPTRELVWRARQLELELASCARQLGSTSSGRNDNLQRAARELLALQSSDWAFMLKHDLAADYPAKRFDAHASALETSLLALSAAPDPTVTSDSTGPRLRDLAPDLRINALFEPVSATVGDRAGASRAPLA